MKRPPTTLRRPPAAEPPPARMEEFIRGEPRAPADAPRPPQAPAGAHGSPQEPTGAHGRLRGTRAVVTREDGRQTRKTSVHLELRVAEALNRYCAARGRLASAVINEALADLLRREGHL